MKPVRISVTGLMVAVGLIGVVLGAFRTHVSLGSFVAGTLAIALVRILRKADRARAAGEPIGDRRWLGLYARSVGDAAFLLALSMLPGALRLATIDVLARVGGGWVAYYSGLWLLLAILAGWPASVMARRTLRWDR